METFRKIEQWAKNREITDQSTPGHQYGKLLEEVGELGTSLVERARWQIQYSGADRSDFNLAHSEAIDAIGDCVVVLTIIAAMLGTSIDECIQQAYDTIKARKGMMISGKFFKYDNLDDQHKAIIDARVDTEAAPV